MKKLFAILCCVLMLAGCTAKSEKKAEISASPTITGEVADPMKVDKIQATIEMMDGGKIVLDLYPSKAPQSVCNFVYLARKGFYDGLIFNRVISGFMIQGGDPNGDGTGGPGYTIKGEFSANGVENTISHIRGTISCARQNDPYYDTAGSQFFIVHKDSKFLDGKYAAFGRVTEGMDIVDAIASVETNSKTDKPLKDVVIKTITIDGPLLPEPDKIQ